MWYSYTVGRERPEMNEQQVMIMVSSDMMAKVKGGSAIRKLFEEGAELARKYGAENVCDFSLGNPNVPAPETVREAMMAVLEDTEPAKLHGYMPNTGFPEVRAAVAESINRRHGTKLSEKNIVMCTGAAAGINVVLKTILNPGEEVVAIAPFFVEYGNYVSNHGGVLKIVPPNAPDFRPDPEKLSGTIGPKTRAVIINTPNNPTGIVYSAADLRAIADVLERKEREYGTDIYLISDEPYRELVYDPETAVPYVPGIYRNTIVCYSWSKSLSLPGERIGYVEVPAEVSDFDDIMDCLSVATRIMGFVNAPSLQQLAVARCLEDKADIDFYRRNRDMLCAGLEEIGFTFARPAGAFYLWLKSPFEDEEKFVEMAKKHLLLLVAGRGFACPGYVRLAYCTAPEVIERSIPKFRALMEDVKRELG